MLADCLSAMQNLMEGLLAVRNIDGGSLKVSRLYRKVMEVDGRSLGGTKI